MFEGAVAGILNRLLGKYVQDLDTENLNVGIFSGQVNLSDLKLKPEALYELDLPIDVKIGTIGRINLQIPWTGLYTQPVIVNIEDVLVLVGPAISNSYFDPEREKRLTRAAKRKILQDLEAESEILKGPQNFFEHLFTAIVNNLQIYIRNVHVRYEDSISSKDGPLACGLCLQSLSIETTNSKWKPSVTPANATTVYQMMRIESLSLYWNPTATALDDAEIANITPMQYYNWKHYMMTGLDKFSMHHEDFEFLLKPVTCKVKVLINRSSEARVPRLLLDAVLQDSALQLSRRQFLSIDNLLSSFHRIQLNRKYRHLHPGVPLSSDIKKWWKYAYNVVVEQRVRPYTWGAIQRHRAHYKEYKQTYKSTLRSPHDTELKLDLQQCEDSLPIVAVVIAREHAKYELLAQEPDRIEVVESEFDWWKSEEDEPHVELCVKTERKTLWSHLSSPERKKVCELIGYVEGAPKDKSKQYIEHKLNLTLANCSLTLMNRNKEVLGLTLTQFLASLETRPSAKAYKLSARAESIVMEGLSTDGELVPLLTAERGSPTSTNLLALDIEKNPASSEADYGLSCLLEPVEVLYVEHAFTELINFFQTHSMTSEELFEELSHAADAAAGVGRSVLAYAVSRKKMFQVNVDVKGPCVILPEYGCATKTGKFMVLDISRVLIKSDLQPSNLALEDATCMELEERLYDRLHAECSFQVLFSEGAEEWREARRLADSELHLMPRLKGQVVFSNSIKKDYKLLPRYKLNISLSSLKFNLSQRTIASVLDFLDTLPIPVPNTVPVSFMDSGDYAEFEEPEQALLMLDKVPADPGHSELVQLRQRIVAAYLGRNRAAESTFDRAGAKLGFQESNQVFISSEHSDEDMEVYARSVDLPGFDDNVSPSNNINTLLRFVVGEIVINLSRTIDKKDHPYMVLGVSKVCLDVALMQYGPALQLSVARASLVEHAPSGAQDLLAGGGELLNVLYRKYVRAAPRFYGQQQLKSHGELKLHVGRLQLVLLHCALHHLQVGMGTAGQGQLQPPASCLTHRLINNSWSRWSRRAWRRRRRWRPSAPPSARRRASARDLVIENFFKQTNPRDASSPVQSPVIDNILIKLVNEPILEPVALRCDLKRGVSYQQQQQCASQRGLLLCDAHVAVDTVLVSLGHRDLATLRAVWTDNLSEARYIGNYTNLSTSIDYFSDSSTEMRASLQSLLVEDIRPDPGIVIEKIFQSQCYSSRGGAGISVCRPPLLDAHVRVSGARATSCDVRVDRTRLNLAAPFPEIMLFTDLTKSDGHALLLRTELIIDYSSHSNTDNFVLVLKPCDLEFSKSFKTMEEGVKVKLSVSEIEVHLAATTVHTVIDIMEEIQSELALPENESFNFSTSNPKFEKQDDELWSPKKITPYVLINPEDSYVQPKYPAVKVQESFDMVIPSVRVLLEVEQTVRVPVLMVKLTGELSLHDWSRQLHGSGSMSLRASCYNERLGCWEPLLEPVVCRENVYRPTQKDVDAETSFTDGAKRRKRSEFESETSADEDNTDNEMTFIKNPQGSRKDNVDYNSGNMSFLKAKEPLRLTAHAACGRALRALTLDRTACVGALFEFVFMNSLDGGFPSTTMESTPTAWRSPLSPPAGAERLRRKLVDKTLTIKLHDLDELTIPCPQRTASKLHVLHPSKNNTRYYIVVERTSNYNHQKIVVRSPLQELPNLDTRHLVDGAG
ncbi:hypothetical protein MSG28_009485 [Choristoneura fumiferana]|uniref:Uncharacterized protein n=1 Tax=Choristoneura fumiferana TaxID=7141 RepID=A0ACC0JBN3_CHOFU|nr:hypothetical protein MSG28_009485 [Choristoneura fumiferana]